MAKILFMVDVPNWAIGHLAQSKIENNPHHNCKMVSVHPRDAKDKADEFEQAVKDFKPDLICYEYFRSAVQLIEEKPFLKSYKTILVHHNQRDKALGYANWKDLGIDLLVTHTNKARELLNELGHLNVKTINHGIDLDFFQYSDQEPEEVNIGYVGRIVPWKGLKEIADVGKELGVPVQIMGKQDKPDYWTKVDKTMLRYDFMDCSDEERVDAYHNMTIYVGNSTDGYEEGCYDDKTEVLTDKGWKLFKDVKYEDKIATLNPKTEELEYQKPRLLVSYKDKKELIRIKNSSIDIAVTKNHNMWISSATTGKNRKQAYKKYEFRKAKDLPSNFKIKRTCNWIAKKSNKSLNWFALVGLYLAEGSIKNNTSFHLAVCKEEIRIKTEKLLNQLKLNYRKQKDGFVVKDKELVSFFKPLGKASVKYIPSEVKQSSKKEIEKFLEWFTYGDGHLREGGWREFYSSSKKLIDDLQECLIKIGRNGNINVRDYRGQKRWIVNHWANVNCLAYEINERVKKTDAYIRKGYDMSIEKYNGVVYCAEVPNHIMLVRRNGTAYFCGNTLPFLEAMACGVPVVTTLSGVARDIIKDGYNALVVDFDDPVGLKIQIEKLLNDKELRDKLRKNAWNTVKNMTVQKMAYEYSKTFHEVLHSDHDLVSVILPTYNRKDNVIEILGALKQQSYPNIEVVVCDDNSDDGTEEAVLKYREENKDMTIKYLNTKQDGYNLAMARNMGAIEAEGKILMFCDSRLKPDEDAVLFFKQGVDNASSLTMGGNKKVWFFGEKGAKKQSFVENFSAVSRQLFIDFGMFCERIDKYGGMSQEVRSRWKRTGGETFYLESAVAKVISGSKNSSTKRDDIVKMKFKLFKMYGNDRH